METLGQALNRVINEFGIRGELLDLSADVDTREVYIATTILDSDGNPALNEAGDDVAVAWWEVSIDSAPLPHVEPEEGLCTYIWRSATQS